MAGPESKNVKRAQKEEQLLRELSTLLLEITLDDSRLSNLFINRVHLAADKSICTIYIYSPDGKKKFDELKPILILYKPSLRAAIAKRISRPLYAPTGF